MSRRTQTAGYLPIIMVADTKIPYSRQWISEEDIAAVNRVLRSDRVTQGESIDAFERDLERLTGAESAVAVSNGSAALHLACRLFGLDDGGIGVTSPITFAASANCIRYCGAEVRFADVDSATGLMDPDALEETLRKIDARGAGSRVIVTVSMAGRAAPLPAIRSVADRFGYRVIEDAAHSFGATYPCGDRIYASASCRHSDAATLSFHPVKLICCGEGGAVLTGNSDCAAELRQLRNHGLSFDNFEGEAASREQPQWYREQVDLGWNYRLTDIQASLGLSQLQRLGAFLKRRRELARRYRSFLEKPPFSGIISLSPEEEGHVYHLFVVHFTDEETRNSAYRFLRERNILTQVHYIPLYRHPYYKGSGENIPLAGAEAYFRGCLSLPLYPKLTDEEQDRVIEALEEFCCHG